MKNGAIAERSHATRLSASGRPPTGLLRNPSEIGHFPKGSTEAATWQTCAQNKKLNLTQILS